MLVSMMVALITLILSYLTATSLEFGGGMSVMIIAIGLPVSFMLFVYGFFVSAVSAGVTIANRSKTNP